MKKLLTLLLCVVCLFSLVLTMVGCDGTLNPNNPNKPDNPDNPKPGETVAKPSDKVTSDDLWNALSFDDVISNFVIKMSVVNSDFVSDVYCAGSIADANKINLDAVIGETYYGNGWVDSGGNWVYTKQYGCNVAFVRDGKIYTGGSDIERLSSDMVTVAKALLTAHPDVLEYWGTVQDVLDELEDDNPDIGELVNSLLTPQQQDGLQAVVMQLYRNMLGILFNSRELTDTEYVLSIDANKLFDEYWTKIYTLAKYADSNSSATLSQLYNNPVCKGVLSPFIKDITAVQVEDLLIAFNDILKAEGGVLPFEIPKANAGDDAYDYIGKFIDSYKLDGAVTLGSMRISDIVDAMFGEDSDISFADYMDAYKTSVRENYNSFFQNLKAEVRFDGDKALRKISVSYDNRIEEAKVAIDFSLELPKTAPTLIDISKYIEAPEETCKDGHTWSDGKCVVCKEVCTHPGCTETTEKCPVCGKELIIVVDESNLKDALIKNIVTSFEQGFEIEALGTVEGTKIKEYVIGYIDDGKIYIDVVVCNKNGVGYSARYIALRPSGIYMGEEDQLRLTESGYASETINYFLRNPDLMEKEDDLPTLDELIEYIIDDDVYELLVNSEFLEFTQNILTQLGCNAVGMLFGEPEKTSSGTPFPPNSSLCTTTWCPRQEHWQGT